MRWRTWRGSVEEQQQYDEMQHDGVAREKYTGHSTAKQQAAAYQQGAIVDLQARRGEQ